MSESSPIDVFHTVAGRLSMCDFVRALRDGPGWLLEGRGLLARKRVRSVKRDIALLLLRGFESVILAYSEDPIDEGPAGVWRRVGNNSWVVPPDVDVDELLEWLHLGNWQLYCFLGDKEHKKWAFPFHVEPAEFFNRMEEDEVAFCIDSFHDDVSWSIYLNPRFTISPNLKFDALGETRDHEDGI